MTRILFRLFPFFLAGAFLLAACGTPTSTPSDNLNLEITQTMQAVATNVKATLEAAMPTQAPPPTSTPAPTSTPLPVVTLAPTDTPTPILTPAAPPIQQSTAPIAHVNQNTNCRSGPANVFGVVYTAMKGEELKVVSKTVLNGFVVVENPKISGQSCWLWTQYVDISGDLSNLSVATQPPSPTSALDFSLSFYRIESCSGSAPGFKVVNTGAVTLNSTTMVVKDTNTHSQQTTTTNQFDKRDGCDVTKTISALEPGDTGFIYSDSFSSDDLSGHTMTATITVCSHKDLAGTCVTQSIAFTP
jgi:hypothetical protein